MAKFVLIPKRVDLIQFVVDLPADYKNRSVLYTIVEGRAIFGTLAHKTSSSNAALPDMKVADEAKFAS